MRGSMPGILCLSLPTKKLDNKVEVRVEDNGNGIPQKVLDKIFQPFFTTKSPGQGTGLGLSLSYDIIKAHGGEIKVKTTEGEFAEFVIHLPTNSINVRWTVNFIVKMFDSVMAITMIE